MDVHFDSGFGKATFLSRFSDTEAIELYRFDGALHLPRQPLYQSPDVIGIFRGSVVVICDDLIRFIYRHIGERCSGPTEEINQFVARDAVDPRREMVPRDRRCIA